MQDAYQRGLETGQQIYKDYIKSRVPYYVFSALDTEECGREPFFTFQCAFREKEDAKLFVKAARAKNKKEALPKIFKIEDQSTQEEVNA